MALTKADFAERLFDELGLDKRKAKAMVELFFEEIKSSLEQGKQVKISGFGKFELRDKTSRPGRNPKTGEEIPITARRVATFRSGQKLKARVEAYVGAVIQPITLRRTGRLGLAQQFKLVAVFLRISTLGAREIFTQK
jgi:integration host factor subunit alpha